MEKFDFVCFGGGDWWYHNRAHIDMQLMRRFAKNGTAIYVNSIVIQRPYIGKKSNFTRKLVRKAKSIARGLKRTSEGFWVYSPFTLPVHHIPYIRQLNELFLRMQIKHVLRKLKIRNPVLWVTCPGACDTSLKLKKSKLVWQRTDRWEEFPNVDSSIIAKYDRKLKANSDLTVYVSSFLYEEEYWQCKKAFYLDHGVDYELFAHAHEDKQIPEDMTGIPKPIVGFFGGIDDHTSDVKLLEALVDLLPEMSFVFVGPASSDCAVLMSKRNVWMLGQKPYEKIPHYGKCFNVAIMPWRQNRWIEACNPIKLKEYLALGKPVVSTPFPELKKYRDIVYEAKTSLEFVNCIQNALKEDNQERIVARRKKVQASTWDSKAESIVRELFGKNNNKNW
ncbi:MAG: glycosyltransferase [Planctomycetota bacterium]